MLDTEAKQAILDRVSKIPIYNTLKMEIVSLEDKSCEVRVPRDLKYDGVFESFHGGLLMTVADSTACFAIMTRTSPDMRLTTTDMNIRFLAPCLSDLTARARVIKMGRSLCPVAVDMFDAHQTQVAVAQVTYILLGAAK